MPHISTACAFNQFTFRSTFHLVDNFYLRMTSRVFLDRVQATPDKKDQLTKESASSPCPERTIKLSGKPIPQEVLDDLCARFLLNIPESGMSGHHVVHLHTIALNFKENFGFQTFEEKDDLIRLMFQVELAHWFYIDFHRVENPSLPEMRLPQFTGSCLMLFQKFSS